MDNPVIEAGILPEPGVLLLTFYPEPEFIGDDLLVIGDDEGTKLAMRPDGMIISVDKETLALVRFVNSSPERLAECIRAYVRYCERIGSCSSEAEELECVDQFEREVREIDADALADPEQFWATIVEQARDGML